MLTFAQISSIVRDAHPEFGNHYFGLYRNQFADDAVVTIVNADTAVAELSIDMIEDGNGDLHYSAHRHDYRKIGNRMIDGGDHTLDVMPIQ